MAQTLRTYSPQEVTATWGGYVTLRNFADGTAIEIARTADNSNQLVGMQGDVGLTYNADKTGTVTMTFMQTGETNRQLSAIQELQDTSGELIRADLVISDPSGSNLCIARNCHIMTPATMELGDDQASKEWVWFAERIDYTALPVGFAGSVQSTNGIFSNRDGIKSASDALQALLG